MDIYTVFVGDTKRAEAVYRALRTALPYPLNFSSNQSDKGIVVTAIGVISQTDKRIISLICTGALAVMEYANETMEYKH